MVTMKKESEVLLAMNLFVKDFVVPEEITTDASAAETSSDVRAFCIQIGTTLKTLEEGAPWELSVGLLKLSVGKDMESSDCVVRL